MTRITYSAAPRWRETEVVTRDAGRTRPLIVALEPTALLVRLKGTRMTLRMPYSTAFSQAAAMEARRRAAEKKINRKLRREKPAAK